MKVKIETIYRERGFSAYSIIQDGVKVGEISGCGGEYYVYLGDKKDPNIRPVARFKYAKALANAKDFLKFVLARATVEEMKAGIAADTPLGWAQKTWGYESLNMRTCKKREAEYKARQAAFAKMVLV